MNLNISKSRSIDTLFSPPYTGFTRSSTGFKLIKYYANRTATVTQRFKIFCDI